MRPLDQQLARRIVEDAPVLALLLDTQGAVRYANPFCLHLIGCTLGELQGRDWFDTVLPPADRAPTRARFERVMAGEPPQGTVNAVLTRDGDERQIDWTSQPLTDDGGRISGLLAIGRDVTDRLRAERLLRISEQHHRGLFEANPHPMWVYDRESLRFLTVNDAAVAQYGYTREEFAALSLRDLRPPAEVARLLEVAAQPLPRYRASSRWTHRRKDGSDLQVQVSAHDLDFDGRAARLVLALDVTEQVELERRLQLAHHDAVTAHDRLRDVLERIDDGVVALDLDWRYTYVNQRAAILLARRQPADLVGRPIWQEYPEAEGGNFHRACEQALRSQQLVLLEQFFAPGERWFENRIYPSADGLSIYFTDITRRRQAQDALRQSEERFRHFFDAGLVGMAITVPSKHWGQFNARLCEMLGRSADEMQRLTWAELTHPEDLAADLALFEEVLAGQRDGYAMDKRFIRADGSVLQAAISVRCERDAQGRAERFFAVVEDIGARKQAEAVLTRHRDELEHQVQARTRELVAARDEAQQASRAKGEFLSRTSHELRTPLNAILGFGQLLEADPALSARHLGQVQQIMRAGKHLLTLINDVLDLARVESGATPLSPEPMRLDELTAEAVRLVTALADAHGIRIRVAPLDGLAVRADRTRLHQVLLNLLSNAIKYNRPGGEVEVSAAPVHGRMRVEVADRGPGVAPDRLHDLFQPFQRLGAEFSDVEGTGMGLAISRQLVELMGGQIGVVNRPDGGACFWLELPAAPPVTAPPPVPGPRTPPLPTPADGTRRVLYIEDNPVNQQLLAQIAARHPGLQLQGAIAGREGLERALAEPPDLILLDIHLPDLDGYAVLQQLQRHPATRLVPVVAVTADAMVHQARRDRRAGLAGYLTKPVDVAEVDGLFAGLWQGRAGRGG